MRASLVLCIAAMVPALASAQGTQNMPSYWSSLSAAPTLRAAMGVARPDSVSTSDAQVADGMLRLRAYEITLDKTDAFVATHALETAVERAPQNAWAHFALGAALARGPDIRERSLAEKNSYQTTLATISNAAARAPKELRRALALDPTLDAAAIEYGHLAVDLHDRKMMREAITMLTTGTRTNYTPGLMLAAQLDMRLDRAFEALQLATKARDAGYDASLADHQRAVALFAMAGNEDEGAKAYFAGLDHLTADGAAVYFAPMAMLVTRDQVHEWHGLALDQRKEWLQHFWDRSAALSGVSLGRRIAEQYRRYTKIGGMRSAPVVSDITEDAPDTAAAVHKPVNAFALLFGKPTIEKQSTSVLTLSRYGDPMRADKFLMCEPGWDTLAVPLQPSLAECMRSQYGRSRQFVNAMLAQDQADAKALRGEGYYPNYARNLSMTWEVLQFRAAGGGAQVVAAVATRGASAATLFNDDGQLEPVITFTLADTADDWIRRGTSHNNYAAKSLTPQTWLLFGASTAAPAGRDVIVHVALENRTASAGVIAHGKIDVSAFDPDSLTMSDIVLSPPDAFGSFQRGEVRVALAPGRSFTVNEAPTLYYEVYGLPKNAAVTTEVRIIPLRASLLDRMRAALGRDDGSVSLKFAEQNLVPDSVFGLQQTRTVGLGMLLPGQYTIRVVITDQATGRTVTRDKALQVDAIEVTPNQTKHPR